MAQQSVGHYLRHGQIPFFRLEMADIEASGPAAYGRADAVVLGVPYDGGTTYQPGARLAPWHLRRVSALIQPFHPTHRVDVFDTLRVVDGGNVPAPPFSPAAMRELVQGEISSVVAAGAKPFVVGGDHSISLPVLRALAQVHGPLAVVHVDAHFDTSTAEAWGEPFHHGTPIRNAIEEQLVAPGRLFQVGLRGGWKDEHESDCGAKFDARVVAAADLDTQPLQRVGEQIREVVGDHPTYLTFDIDAVDPAFAPGTGTPVPGGLTSREALALVRSLAGIRLVGMDLVEVAPALDHADITCHLAAHLLYEGLALAALDR
jgi:agmatinase